MTKHRTITGFVAVALLAAATTAAIIRSHRARSDGMVVSTVSEGRRLTRINPRRLVLTNAGPLAAPPTPGALSESPI
jgi:hypothetical protein